MLKVLLYKEALVRYFLESQFIGILRSRNIYELCRKGNQKLYTLSRCAKYMSIEKRRTLFKAFIVSQCNCCPFMWMFHTKELNNQIYGLHEGALRITYQDNELLKIDESVSIHHRNILLIEIY